MSFDTAVTELQAQLTSASLTEYPDPRAESLLTVGGPVDGAYLLRARNTAEPWFDAQKSPTVWQARMRLEICTLLTLDELTQIATASTRGQAATEGLLHTSLTNGTVINSQAPEMRRNGKDRRLVWTWDFTLRYAE